ncbi:MAG: PolC-type DNA polymerase III [Petrotogales bacterium]
MKKMSLKDRNFVILDTETTGLSPHRGARLIEVAALRIEKCEINERDCYSELINPECPIPIFITRLTGISSRMVKTARTVDKVLPDFIDFLGDDILVIQNAPFDLSFLDHHALDIGLSPVKNEFIDTISLSRSLFRGRHNLDTILARLNILPENRHRALGDVLATARAFLQMSHMIGEENIGNFVRKRYRLYQRK